MEHLNQALFLLLNASIHPSPFVLFIASIFAVHAIWLVPLILVTGWLRGNEVQRKIYLQAAGAGLFGLLLNQIIGLLWVHPRPFMIGLGHTLIPHAADSSFPSDHLTLLWSVAISLSLHLHSKTTGLVLSMLGIPVAWARIYLGVHFPMDMAGALAISALSAVLCRRAERTVFSAIYPTIFLIYCSLCAPLIRRGLLRL